MIINDIKIVDELFPANVLDCFPCGLIIDPRFLS